MHGAEALNARVRGLLPSATVAINERCSQMRAEGREVFRLGLGQSPFPVPSPVVEALRQNAARKEYLEVRGLRTLREAVADYQRRRHGSVSSADDVLIGPGSKELMFLLQIAYDGELLVPTPAWVSYAPQARIAGRTVHFLSTRPADHWLLQATHLDAMLRHEPARPRILVLNYPSNPTGMTYPVRDLEDLAEVARRYGIFVLSDEIYGELQHDGAHTSISSFYPEGTIVSGGLSKWCGAGGWRLGTLVFPPQLRWLLDAMTAIASETYTTTSAPIQYAAVQAFVGGLFMERYLRQVRRILSALADGLGQHLREAKLGFQPPHGAFYFFVEFGAHATALHRCGITSSATLCERLLEDTGVAILPGQHFGRPADELSARIAYVDFDGARALSATEDLLPDQTIGNAFLERYCEPTLRAISRMCNWLPGPA